MSTIKHIGVFTSGGDAPGMNAAVRAVVRAALYYNIKISAIYRGYEGMIENDIEEFDSRSVAHIIDKGGTKIKTARSKAFLTKEGRNLAYKNLKSRNIDALIAIGGDGTFTGAHIFYQEFDMPIIGIPGTIDNDIFGTSYTIGYDTASNNAMHAVDMIRDTATSHNRLFFVEVMGRNAGFIALRTAIATGAKAVMLPETKVSTQELLDLINKGKTAKKTSSIVIVAEGNENGNAVELAEQIKALDNSFDTKVTILGHIQRGGSPTTFDRVLAAKLGVAAVDSLLEGKKDIMVGVYDKDLTYTPLEKAIKEHNYLDDNLLRIVNILSS
jgi:6-phosphofructokinase 1